MVSISGTGSTEMEAYKDGYLHLGNSFVAILLVLKDEDQLGSNPSMISYQGGFFLLF